MLICGLLAHVFKLNKAISVLSSNISSPPFLPLIIYGSYKLGQWVLPPDQEMPLDLYLIEADPAKFLVNSSWQYFAGSSLLAVGCGVIAGLVSYVLNILRALVPQSLLNQYRQRKKDRVRRELEQKKERGETIGKERLLQELRAAGIQLGDTLLVHSAMSKIGYLENGPKTLVDALLEAVGPTGNLLMPTSPNASFQIEYAKQNPVFDVLNSPSKLGSISEYFRKLPGVKRSAHPTEPVAALGPDA
eukprot:gene7039-8968_t